MAQDGKDRKGDMRREQMMEKRAERLADELELKEMHVRSFWLLIKITSRI